MAKPNTSKKLPCCRVAFGELAKNGSVAYGEFPAGWRVGSCGSGVRLRLKPMFNISLQAEPTFDSLTAVQPPPNTIRLFLFTTSNQLGLNALKIVTKMLG